MYSTFRNEILNKLVSTNLSHQSIQHSFKGPSQENLFTDYFFSPQKKKKVFLHISGVHGVEGYIGSLIQSQILSSLKNTAALPFQMVFVHAVNPYGMAWFYRTNANNVDLNRNGLKNYGLDNPYFVRFKDLLESVGYFHLTKEFLKVLPTVSQIGIGQTVKTVASGQSEFPSSLFYTGSNLQFELRSLIENLKQIVSDDCELYVLDVHSGLGRFNQELLIVDGSQESRTTKFFENCFQTKIFDPSRERNAYPAHGGMPELLRQHWKKGNVFHAFQEFGTRRLLPVMNALIKQSLFINAKNRTGNVNDFDALKSTMLHHFFPEEHVWREQCIRNGVLRFQQMSHYLSN